MSLEEKNGVFLKSHRQKQRKDSPQLATNSEKESRVPEQKAKPALNFYEV